MNGTPMAQGPLGSGGNVDTTSSLKFGHRGSPSDTLGSFDNRGFYLNGRIDEVELFVGRALIDSEIQAIYNAGSAGKCKAATGLDHFKCYKAEGETAECGRRPRGSVWDRARGSREKANALLQSGRQEWRGDP